MRDAHPDGTSTLLNPASDVSPDRSAGLHASRRGGGHYISGNTWVRQPDGAAPRRMSAQPSARDLVIVCPDNASGGVPPTVGLGVGLWSSMTT